MATATWTGASGAKYTYTIYDLGTNFNSVAGNYMFVKRGSDGRHSSLYVGQTENLKARLTPSHHKWPCAVRNGMTHIAAHTNSSAVDRRAEEEDLLARFTTACND